MKSQGKSIADVLEMTVSEALWFFRADAELTAHVRAVRARLRQVTLDDAWTTALCTTAELFGVASVRKNAQC